MLLKATETKTESCDEGFGSKKKMALLDLLLQSTIDGDFLSNEDIREEIDTFMFEVSHITGVRKQAIILSELFFHCQGHDTTNSALAFTLYNIGKHQEVQQKCVDEIQNVFGEDSSKPVDMKCENEVSITATRRSKLYKHFHFFRQLNELKYMELVIKETLRLYPSVPLFGRKVTEEINIS